MVTNTIVLDWVASVGLQLLAKSALRSLVSLQLLAKSTLTSPVGLQLPVRLSKVSIN